MTDGRAQRAWLPLFFSELRARGVLETVAAYAVVVWVLLQLGEVTFEPLGLPPDALRWLVIVCILLFPLVAVLSWSFDISWRGIRRDERKSELSAAQRFVPMAIVLVVDVALAVGLMRFYAVQPTPATTATEIVDKDYTAPTNTIALLPFAAAADDAQIADGLVDELRHRLRASHGLKVAARTSTVVALDQATNALAAGRLLGVSYVLTGALSIDDENARLDAELVDVRNGQLVYSERIERPASDLVGCQQQLLEGLTRALGPATASPLVVPAADRVAEAVRLYWEGRGEWQRRTPQSLARAIELFEQAIAADPTSASAYAGLADAHMLSIGYANADRETALSRASSAAERALELDGGSSEAFASLGLIKRQLGQANGAESFLRQALRLDPANSNAQLWLAGLLGDRGRLIEKHELVTGALERDPLHPLLKVIKATNDYSRGEADLAFAALEAQLRLTPDATPVLNALIALLLDRGRFADAERYVARLLLAPQSGKPAAYFRLRSALMLGEIERVKTLAEAVLNEGELSADLRLDLTSELAAHLPELYLSQLREALAMHYSASRTNDAYTEPLTVILIRHAEAALLGGTLADDRTLVEQLQRLARDGPPTPLTLAMWTLIASAETGDAQADALARARVLVDMMVEQGFDEPTFHYLVAVVQSLGQDSKAAAAALQTAVGAGFTNVIYLARDPRLASLRRDPAFAAIAQRHDARVLEQRQALGALQPLASLGPRAASAGGP